MDKWVKDLRSYIDAIPYGNVNVGLIRVDRHTVQVTTHGEETLRYRDNNEALKDILTFITSLIDDKHTGDVQFQVDMQEGNITLLTIKNTRRTNYQK